MATDDNNDVKANFNSKDYSPYEGTYYSSDEAYANHHQMVLSFQHVPSEESVYFQAFISAFNETYTSDWTPESVFGRLDPIQTFRQNTRVISLNFKIPSSYAGQAYENLTKIQKLIQFLYPTYENGSQANTLTQSPLIRLKVMNLLQNGANFSNDGDPTRIQKVLYDSYANGTADANAGILGVISNLTVNHNLESIDGVIEAGTNTILPKLIDVSLSFTVIHEHKIGWNENKESLSPLFPYGATATDVPRLTFDEAAEIAAINAETLAESELSFNDFKAGLSPAKAASMTGVPAFTEESIADKNSFLQRMGQAWGLTRKP